MVHIAELLRVELVRMHLAYLLEPLKQIFLPLEQLLLLLVKFLLKALHSKRKSKKLLEMFSGRKGNVLSMPLPRLWLKILN